MGDEPGSVAQWLEHLTTVCKILELGGNQNVDFSSELFNGCFKDSKGPKTLSLFTSYLSYVTSLEILASTLVGAVRIPKRKYERTPQPKQPRFPYLLKLLKAAVTPGWDREDMEEASFYIVYHYFKYRTFTGAYKAEV